MLWAHSIDNLIFNLSSDHHNSIDVICICNCDKIDEDGREYDLEYVGTFTMSYRTLNIMARGVYEEQEGRN